MIAVCVIVIIAIALSGGGSSNKPVAQTPTQKAATTQARPVTASRPAFPPKTLAAFRAFAATGDASRVHEISKSTKNC